METFIKTKTANTECICICHFAFGRWFSYQLRNHFSKQEVLDYIQPVPNSKPWIS